MWPQEYFTSGYFFKLAAKKKIDIIRNGNCVPRH